MPVNISGDFVREIGAAQQRDEAARVYRDPRPDWASSDIFGEVVYAPSFRERLLLLLGAKCFFRWRVTTQQPPGAVQIGSEVDMVTTLAEGLKSSSGFRPIELTINKDGKVDAQ